ncbi:MAG: MFS transporter [Actinomycetota bacterium]|nr:MFS transporter [Actinomycetota bacterium]
MSRLRERLRESLRALREVYRNPALRRLQLAWAGSIIGSWAYAIALVVYAYRHGGASAVGLIGLLRWLPAAAAAPFAAILGDRYPRVPVMLGSDLVRAAGLGGMTACVLTHAPFQAVYALASIVAVTTTAFQPAQAAILPSLARTPEELTAANVSSSTIESLGFCVGPALGGLLLSVSTVWVVFAVTAGTFLWSALLLTGLLRSTEPPLRREPTHLLDEAAAGFRAIARNHRLRLVVGLFSAQTLVNGAFTVLVAVSALELLDLGPAGVGYLNAAVGVGGILGGFVSLTLVGQRRLATTFGIAVAGTGGPLLLVGALPRTGTTLAVFGLIGLAIIVEDVAGFTLIQRATPSEVLARVFGVLHSLFYGTVAVGAILAPVLIDAVGVRWALVTVGSVLPVLSVLTHASLAELDAAPGHQRELELLRSIPIFAPLSPPVLEQLSARLVPVHVPAGEEIVRRGEPGERFYIVAEGEVEILVDEGPPRREGPGSYFGEIALLRDVPRTATVRAMTDVELYALDREDFLGAVTGHAGSAQAAEAVVGSRLGISTV